MHVVFFMPESTWRSTLASGVRAASWVGKREREREREMVTRSKRAIIDVRIMMHVNDKLSAILTPRRTDDALSLTHGFETRPGRIKGSELVLKEASREGQLKKPLTRRIRSKKVPLPCYTSSVSQFRPFIL
jgi:hypothetical protein